MHDGEVPPSDGPTWFVSEFDSNRIQLRLFWKYDGTHGPLRGAFCDQRDESVDTTLLKHER